MAARPRMLSTLLLIWFVLLARTACAQRIVLLRPQDSDPVVAEALSRLQAELRLHAFEVIVLDTGPSSVSPETLAEAARASAAFASVSIVRDGHTTSAQVWIVDRITGKTSIQRLAPRDEKDAPTVLALRAADLLRASLSASVPDEPPPPEVLDAVPGPPPPAVQAWTTPSVPSWRLGARAAALGLASSLGTAFGPSLRVAHRLGRRVEAGILLGGPFVGAGWTAPGGSASVTQAIGTGQVSFRVWQPGPVKLEAAVGGGVYRLEARGTARPPLVSTSDHVTSAVGSLGLELEVKIASHASLGSELTALWLTPRPAVAVGSDQTQPRMPLLMAALGLDLAF